LEQVAQTGSESPIPGNIQGQVGQGSEQPGLVEDIPDHCRALGLRDFKMSLSTQSILSYKNKVFSIFVLSLWILFEEHR